MDRRGRFYIFDGGCCDEAFDPFIIFMFKFMFIFVSLRW